MCCCAHVPQKTLKYLTEHWGLAIIIYLVAWTAFGCLFSGIADLIWKRTNENNPTPHKIKIKWQPPGRHRTIYNQVFVKLNRSDLLVQKGDTITVYADPGIIGKVVLDQDQFPPRLSQLI